MICRLAKNYLGEVYLIVAAEDLLEQAGMSNLFQCVKHTDEPDDQCRCLESVVLDWSLTGKADGMHDLENREQPERAGGEG